MNAPPVCGPLLGLWLATGEESYDCRGVLGVGELGVTLETGVALELAEALTGVLATASVEGARVTGRAGAGCRGGGFGIRRIVE